MLRVFESLFMLSFCYTGTKKKRCDVLVPYTFLLRVIIVDITFIMRDE